MSPSPPAQAGLVIVDHGTRGETANRPLIKLAESLAVERPDWLIAHAHMELAEPDFPSAIDALVERGAKEILVHLHFLGEGYHVRKTLPALIAEARSRHPEILIRVTDPLGRDPRITEIVLSRMDQMGDSSTQ
ncbi:MAG: CbiX/SirB N-terminal domain-containing protein [Myxococcales bacterium]|nr:hypothetical protein [Myxococcales bacterium]HIK85859.1 hypothetical protein [Myxococcales bacterium]